MWAVLLTFSFINRILTGITDLPETTVLLVIGVGLIALTVGARLWLRRGAGKRGESAEMHLSQHGGKAEARN